MVLAILAMMNVATLVLEFVGLLILGGALAATVSTICGTSLVTLKCIESRSYLNILS
jgi:hypothetical protein